MDHPRGQDFRRAVSGGSAEAREELQARIGHRFLDSDILIRALTHPSAAYAAGVASQLGSYQRLEFLGDRVLGLVVADMLTVAFPEADEGALHRRHASLVRKETCAAVGSELGIGEALVLDDGEENSGGRAKTTILGDACEALIGAIYRDGGLAPARAMIERYWEPRMLDADKPRRDAKSTLQEWAQARGVSLPEYKVAGETGPQHAPRFAVRVEVDNLDPAVGEGNSKREAEQAAATAMLIREGVWKAGSE